MNVFIVGGPVYADYANWLPNAKRVHYMDDADLVLFAGGEDVHPIVYGEPVGSRTHYNYARDVSEGSQFEQALLRKKPMLGICRGSQLICALSGGRLIQHQENPSGFHNIQTIDGRELGITSSHHQAQYPYEMKADSYKLIGWTKGMSSVHLDGEDKEISDKPFPEAEIVYYRNERALGIQGHPEWMHESNPKHKETLDYLRGLVAALLENKL